LTKTVNFRTLGCRLNQSESDVLQYQLRREGYRIVSFSAPADISVINSCAVTVPAEAKTRRAIAAARRVSPAGRIVVMGCYSQIAAGKLAKLQNVDLILGNREKYDLPKFLAQPGENEKRISVAAAGNCYSFAPAGTAASGTHTRAYLKVQDGCDYYCAYCIIPYLRGPSRSRRADDCLEEARLLENEGFREIVLTGINIGTYRTAEGETIEDLIRALLMGTDIPRIRISSIEPDLISGRLIDLIAHEKRICRHLHLPLQHGSDEMLKAMLRRYRAADFAGLVHRIHDINPEICIGTDLMVGFPGESENHFRQMEKLLEELPLSYFHVFRFSPRPGTRAAGKTDDVPFAVKQERSAILRTLGQRKRREFQRRFIGQNMTVLFEQEIAPHQIEGLTDNFIRVKVRAEKARIHRLGTVTFTRLREDYIDGELIGD